MTELGKLLPNLANFPKHIRHSVVNLLEVRENWVEIKQSSTSETLTLIVVPSKLILDVITALRTGDFTGLTE
jgi:hypothetical protein